MSHPHPHPVSAPAAQPASRVTIRDVARMAGVSINTVSRVINDHPEASQATKQKVGRVIDALGYAPNRLARSLHSRQSWVIGMCVTDCTNPNTAQQVRAVQQVLGDAGYGTMIFDTQEDIGRQNRAMRTLDEHMVDGIILHAAEHSETHLSAMPRRVPLVLLNRTVANLKCDCVTNDNREGARLATAHLLAQGHRRVACIAANRDISTVRDRVLGYRQALAAAGVPADDALIARCEIAIEPARETAQRLLDAPVPPTAFFVYNDLMAVGVMAAATARGLSIPGQIALIGFDNIVYAPHLKQPLTTVAQQTREMGEAAAGLLLARMRGLTGPPRSMCFAPQLIVRETSAQRAA